ncbi:hypothetical protein MRX96_054284 [Rhipicephalus microplus]
MAWSDPAISVLPLCVQAQNLCSVQSIVPTWLPARTYEGVEVLARVPSGVHRGLEQVHEASTRRESAGFADALRHSRPSQQEDEHHQKDGHRKWGQQQHGDPSVPLVAATLRRLF